MSKFSFIISLGLAIILTLVLSFLGIDKKWYYYVVLFILSSLLVRILLVKKEKINIKEIIFSNDIISDKKYFNLIYVGENFNNFTILGSLLPEINISSEQLQLVLYRDTKQKEVLPFLLNGEKVRKIYSYNGQSFEVVFEKISEF